MAMRETVPTARVRPVHMAARRCACGAWFEFDALVRDDVVECPQCGRVFKRSAPGSAVVAAGVLQWIAALVALVFATAGVAGMIAFLGAGNVLGAVLAFAGGLFVAALVIAGPMTIRAIAEAVGRLEDRIP